MYQYHGLLAENLVNNKGQDLMRVINNGWEHIPTTFSTMLRFKTKPDKIIKNHLANFNYTIEKGTCTGSDHLPIKFTITTRAIMHENQSPVFNLNKADWQLFKIKTNNWNYQDLNGKNTNEIDNITNNLMEHITKSMEESIPKTKIKIKSTTTTTNEITQLENNLQTLIEIKENIGANRWIKQEINRVNNELKIACESHSNSLWSETIENTEVEKGNAKLFWAKIKRLKGKDIQRNNTLINENDQEINDDQQIADCFKKHWEKVFSILPDDNLNFDLNKEREVEDFLNSPEGRRKTTSLEIINFNNLDDNNYLTRKITLNEIKAILNKIKNKAPGITGINKEILKHLSEPCWDQIIEIYNATLASGKFPNIWKKAKIILIPKPGKDHLRPGNYRPISLLEVPAKLFEKLINIRLTNYLETNELYSARQMGFRKGRSTQEAIMLISSMITAAREADREINIVQRDVSKAFDKVWHGGLQYKLINNYELPDTIIRLLSNFITNRKAKINIKNKNSEFFSIKSGVPQGSCLSPTLYAIYTNDLPQPEEKNETVQFADDVTNVITEPGRSIVAKRRLKNSTITEIEKINDYEKSWKIQTNVNKFTITPVMRQRDNQGITLNNGINIQYKNKVNILGLDINRTGFPKGQQNRLKQAKYQLKN